MPIFLQKLAQYIRGEADILCSTNTNVDDDEHAEKEYQEYLQWKKKNQEHSTVPSPVAATAAATASATIMNSSDSNHTPTSPPASHTLVGLNHDPMNSKGLSYSHHVKNDTLRSPTSVMVHHTSDPSSDVYVAPTPDADSFPTRHIMTEEKRENNMYFMTRNANHIHHSYYDNSLSNNYKKSNQDYSPKNDNHIQPIKKSHRKKTNQHTNLDPIREILHTNPRQQWNVRKTLYLESSISSSSSVSSTNTSSSFVSRTASSESSLRLNDLANVNSQHDMNQPMTYDLVLSPPTNSSNLRWNYNKARQSSPILLDSSFAKVQTQDKTKKGKEKDDKKKKDRTMNRKKNRSLQQGSSHVHHARKVSADFVGTSHSNWMNQENPKDRQEIGPTKYFGKLHSSSDPWKDTRKIQTATLSDRYMIHATHDTVQTRDLSKERNDSRLYLHHPMGKHSNENESHMISRKNYTKEDDGKHTQLIDLHPPYATSSFARPSIERYIHSLEKDTPIPSSHPPMIPIPSPSRPLFLQQEHYQQSQVTRTNATNSLENFPSIVRIHNQNVSRDDSHRQGGRGWYPRQNFVASKHILLYENDPSLNHSSMDLQNAQFANPTITVKTAASMMFSPRLERNHELYFP